jgi:serine/threonine-protein kinase RsbW
VQLAVDEAATNVIQHAYDPDHPGDLTLTWRCEGNRFIVALRDYGRQFDPQHVPPPDISSPLEERQVGGLGLYLITRLMDEVRFDFNPQGGNLLTMVKYLTAGPRDDVAILPLTGRVDAVTAPQVNREVHAQISAGARFILLDLANVTFLSSSGLRALLLIRKELMTLGGELRLTGLQPQVYEVFTLTGFTQVFAIHATVDEARTSFGLKHA